MAENKNERWDGYSKSPLKDPVFGDDGFVGVKIQADTTKVFPKAPTQNQYVHDDLITMNPRIAFLDAIGQDIYDENFYIAESLDKNESRAPYDIEDFKMQLEYFLQHELLGEGTNFDETNKCTYTEQGKKFEITIKEIK